MDDGTDDMLKEMSYLKIFKYMTKVLKALEDDIKTLPKITKESDIRQIPYFIMIPY